MGRDSQCLTPSPLPRAQGRGYTGSPALHRAALRTEFSSPSHAGSALTAAFCSPGAPTQVPAHLLDSAGALFPSTTRMAGQSREETSKAGGSSVHLLQVCFFHCLEKTLSLHQSSLRKPQLFASKARGSHSHPAPSELCQGLLPSYSLLLPINAHWG